MSRILFIFFFYLFSITIVTAQISTTSPYSRFGLGDINYGSLPEFNSLGVPWLPIVILLLLIHLIQPHSLALGQILFYFQQEVGIKLQV